MRGYDSTKPAAPWLSGPYATALLNDFPGEIKKAVRVMPSNALVSFGDKAFNEKKMYLVDAGFFTLFTFPLVKGNPETALNDPNSVVLTETTAKKYFGKEDPMGKVLLIDKHLQLKVTGIAKDPPSNSHLEFDLVHPLSIYYNEPWFKVWINNNNFTYVLLDEHATKEKLESRFPQFMEKYMGEDMAKFGARFFLSLNPLKDIYFEAQGSYSDSIKK
jgi:putative ABC transport system permease protein